MTSLVTLLKEATNLSSALFGCSEDPGYADRERAAFRSDALSTVSATQALATSPGNGPNSPAYDDAFAKVIGAEAAVGAAVPGDGASINHARLEVVSALDAMRSAGIPSSSAAG